MKRAFRTQICCFHIVLVVVFFVGNACAQKDLHSNNKKGIEYINSIFDRMEAQGVETNQTLLYGYFFFDKDKAKLERLNSELLKQSYVFVSLEKIDGEDFTLHVEKVEAHSRDSLRIRGTQLQELATRFSVESYDGFDIGNPDPSKPLISNESFQRFMKLKLGNDLFDLGIRLYDLEINDRAAEVFAECVKQKIKPDVSSYKLAGALFELGKPDEALSNLEQAVKFNPQYVNAYFNLGAVYYDLGEYQKSLNNYESADRLKQNDDKTIYGIAANQYALGKFSRSLENCKRALKINPQNENAKALLEMLRGK